MPEPTYQLLHGDVLEKLGELPDEFVHCVVTSPPYWQLRVYLPDDHPDKRMEIGWEKTPQQYIEKMVTVFREVRRVLRSDGICWIVIADTAARSGRGAGAALDSLNRLQRSNPGAVDLRGRIVRADGYKPLEFVPISWMLAKALREDGWYLRSMIIWAKGWSFSNFHGGSPMPDSVLPWRWERHQIKTDDGWTDCPGCEKCSPHNGFVLRYGAWRPTRAHEYILMLTKSQRYYTDAKDVMENGSMRSIRSVWDIQQERWHDPHYAKFPSAIPRICIRISTPDKGCCPVCGAPWARMVEKQPLEEGNHTWHARTPIGWLPTCSCGREDTIPAVVLDPFTGLSTTGEVALREGRNFIGIDLNEEYIALSEKQLAAITAQLSLFR